MIARQTTGMRNIFRNEKNRTHISFQTARPLIAITTVGPSAKGFVAVVLSVMSSGGTTAAAPLGNPGDLDVEYEIEEWA